MYLFLHFSLLALRFTPMSFSWSTIKTPIVAFAPMSGVSDIAMRSIAKKWGSDITFSEFISAASIHYKNDNSKSFQLAQFIETERPFIIQLFGKDPEHFKTAAKILNKKFRPDGFDINFGCPAHSVINNGAGSCLFLEPGLAKQIIETVKETSGLLPTSIKLRASYKHVGALEFLKNIEGAPFENVTVHMRSYEQVHHGQPNWEIGKNIKEYFKNRPVSVIVNGGIASGLQAKEVLEFTDADGVMVAQASLGNPFIFQEIKATLAGQVLPELTWTERLDTVREHARLMVEYKGDRGIIEMRKHLVWYLKGFPDASQLRQKLVKVESLGQLDTILDLMNIQ